MKQEEFICFRNQEYRILAVENPSPEEPIKSERLIESEEPIKSGEPIESEEPINSEELRRSEEATESEKRIEDRITEASGKEGPLVSVAVAGSHYIIQDRKLKREERRADGSCRFVGCAYSGGLIVARGLNAIPLSEDCPTCYQYDVVIELIIDNGDVIALIDHSRAMKKVAKNLEYQLRSLKKRRDVYVIRRFLKKTFVRKYPVKWVKRG